MHGLFKTASINQIFSVITKRLIILFLWKSREHVYHFYRVSDLYNKDHKGVKHVRIYGRDEDDTPSFAF